MLLNFIFDDKRLKYKYIVDGNPLIKFLRKKFEKNGSRPDLGLELVRAGDFWKIEHLSCCQNFIFDDKRLKYKYIVDSNPLITFLKRNLKKMVPGWI